MPADLEEALQKKGGLTLTQLAIYDDMLTDALVDRVYFWANIRKVRPNARPCRGVREEDVCKILQQNVIIEKDPITAQKAMLRQTGFANYMRSLKTEDEKEHFERHLRRYINLYLPDCPFEVCTTHRYTITTAEACVVARKPIKAGEAIKYLSGIQVEMSEEEEAELSSRTDFSIVLSSRRKRPSLFLGPARFANHDCDSNARLTTTGPHGISIVACKNIAVGDEITVKYGDDYFGEDNCECLCGTCENHIRNGWDPRGPILRDDSSDEESEEEDEPPRKRQRTNAPCDAPTSAPKTTTTTESAPLKRKHDAAFIKAEPTATTDALRKRGRPRKYPLAAEKVTEEYTTHARDFLNSWFEVRARQTDWSADINVSQVKRAVQNASIQNLPDDQKRNHKINSVFEQLQEHGNQELERWQEKLAALKARNAETLGVSMEDAEKYYAPPGHPDHVVLPRKRAKQQSSTEEGSDNAVLGAERHITPNLFAHIRERSRSHLVVTSMRKQHTASPLRKVTLPPGAEEDETQETTDKKLSSSSSSCSVSVTPAEPIQTSTTDDSSRSSVFSNETNAEPVSPPSSLDELAPFAAGNICQNIVDLYTSCVPRSPEADSAMHDAGQDEEHDAGQDGEHDTGQDEEHDTAQDEEHDTAQDEERSSINEPARRGRGRPRKTRGAVASIEQHHDDDTENAINVETNVVDDDGDHDDDEDREGEEEDDDDGEAGRGPPRTPGDYHLTVALLIDINDRWIECRNCDEHFVQHDAYQTRIACPRCERHSKLYGYHWPKTDKTGKDDREERILDHRLIHRFIDPDEERCERKGRKTLAEVLKERELSTSQDLESTSRSATRDDSRRRSRRFA